MPLVIPLLFVLSGAPVSGQTAQGIQVWGETQAGEWAAVAIAISTAGETDLEQLEALASLSAGFGANELTAAGGSTSAYLLEDALVIVDSIPPAQLRRALTLATGRLQRPLEPTRLPVSVSRLPSEVRLSSVPSTIEELRRRLMVRERVSVAVVGPGDASQSADLARLAATRMRARLPKAGPPSAVRFHDADNSGGVRVHARTRDAGELAADLIVAQQVRGELRVTGARAVLIFEPGGRVTDLQSARARARAELERASAHPAERAMQLARLGLVVDGGLPALAAAIDTAEVADASSRFGLELKPTPPEQPRGEPSAPAVPVASVHARPGAQWTVRALGLRLPAGAAGAAKLARVLEETGRFGEGPVSTLVERGGLVRAHARPNGVIVLVEGPARLSELVALATREVAAGPKDLRPAEDQGARRGVHTPDLWRAAFGRVPNNRAGTAASAWAAITEKAVFVDGVAPVRAAAAKPSAAPLSLWPPASAASAPAGGELVAAQVVPFAPRVHAAGPALAAVVEARLRKRHAKASVVYERARGAALLGVRIPIEAVPAPALLDEVRGVFDLAGRASLRECRAALKAAELARQARAARVGGAALDDAERWLVTGALATAAPTDRELSRLLRVVPMGDALRAGR